MLSTSWYTILYRLEIPQATQSWRLYHPVAMALQQLTPDIICGTAVRKRDTISITIIYRYLQQPTLTVSPSAQEQYPKWAQQTALPLFYERLTFWSLQTKSITHKLEICSQTDHLRYYGGGWPGVGEGSAFFIKKNSYVAGEHVKKIVM